jgi:putative hydrolase of HD superfamily
VIDAWLDALKLKALPRAGWRRVGIDAPESVAAHSWGVGLLVLALAPPELDRAKLLAYATVHDLAEALAGDITPHDGVSSEDKGHRERAAMETLGSRGLPAELLELWLAYEAQADEEARFVRQLDRLDMALQALVYAPRAKVVEFVDSAATVVVHPRLRPILDEVRARLAALG